MLLISVLIDCITGYLQGKDRSRYIEALSVQGEQ